MGTVKLQQDSRVGLSCSIWEEKRAPKNNFRMSADEIKKICDIYDWDGKGELDMYYFGDVMYAMGMNIMKSVCIKYGQTNDTGKNSSNLMKLSNLSVMPVRNQITLVTTRTTLN